MTTHIVGLGAKLTKSFLFANHRYLHRYLLYIISSVIKNLHILYLYYVPMGNLYVVLRLSLYTATHTADLIEN